MRGFLPTRKLFFSLYCPLIDVVTDMASSIFVIDTHHIGNSPDLQHDDFHLIIFVESKDCPCCIPTVFRQDTIVLTVSLRLNVCAVHRLRGRCSKSIARRCPKFGDFALESLTRPMHDCPCRLVSRFGSKPPLKWRNIHCEIFHCPIIHA